MLSFPLHLACFCLFAVSLWLSGTLFDEILRCRLLGELLIGLLFGNIAVGTLLPADRTILVLAGELGVLGLIFEAGLGTHLDRVLRAGPRAALVATVGTVVPLATGFGFMYGLSHLDHIQALDRSTGSTSPPPQRVTEAIASGAALASTSIAVAVTMMKQQRVLDSPVGTLITTAAMLDDVVSLILLGIVSSIGQSESASGSGIHAMTVIQPVVASLGIIGVGIIGSVVVARIKAMKTPNVGHELDLDMSDRRHAQDEHGLESADARVLGEMSHGEEDRQRSRNQPGWIWSRVIHLCSRFEAIVKLAGMVTSGLGYSILAEYLGSSRLLGAFVAGVFFSPFVNLQHEYEQQVTIRIQPALSALFFASIGMAIPLTKLLEPALFGWGLVYAVIASLSKLTTMFVVSSKASLASAPGLHGVESGCNVRWMVGTAMIARGELGLLMAQQAQQQGVMSQTAMVVTTWSIVLCTLFGIGALGVVMTNK